jgi:hypothetical protein
MRVEKSTRYLMAICVLVAVYAVAVVMWSTKNGIGISPDSTVYIEAAHNFLAGNGFFASHVLLTHFPPGYPFILAIFSLLGTDKMFLYRLLQGLFYAANGILFGLLVYKSTKQNLLATAIGFLLFYSSRYILRIHEYAWSEPAFLLFTLISISFIASHIAVPRIWCLIVGSLFMGFAVVTRYAGAALFAPVLLGILWLEDQPIKQRVKEAVIALVIGSFPMVIWIVRNLLLLKEATDRGLAIHLPGWPLIQGLFITMANYFVPLVIPIWLSVLIDAVLVIAVVLGMIYLIKNAILKKPLSTAKTLFLLSFLFVLFYILVVILVNSFLDVSTTFDYRIAIPVFIFTLLGGLILGNLVIVKSRTSWMKWVSLVLVILFISLNIYGVVNEVKASSTSGLGFTSVYWNRSKTIQYLKTLPKGMKIYSNSPNAIWIQTNLEAYLVPAHNDYMTAKPIPDYLLKMNSMCVESRSGKAVVVFFNTPQEKWYIPSQKEMQATCNLPIIKTTRDGTIFGEIGK